MDIDNLEEKIHTLEEWDYNIKVIRAKRKELEKLQDLYKVIINKYLFDTFNFSMVIYKYICIYTI